MPDFQPLLYRIKTAPIWVWLPGLPLEYWSEDSVTVVAAKIGKLLRIDARISMHNRGKFMRICVQVNMREPLREGVWIEKEERGFFVRELTSALRGM